MVIQHNMSAMNANRQLGITQGQLQKSTEKLSSGYRINRAGDDAAGLAISEKMRGQIRGLNQASTNSEDGISLVQTAEGALQETQNILQRMRELAVQASNDTNTDDDRTQIQKEINQLTNEVDRIATTSEFNTKKLLDGSQKGVTQAKDGNVSVESTFSNGMVQVTAKKGITNGMSTAKFVARDDVIRITIQRDYTATGSLEIDPADKLSSCKDDDNIYATLTSLNGYGQDTPTSGAKITINVAAGTLTVEDVAVADKDSKLAYSETNTGASATGGTAEDTTGDLVFSISNASSLKAGDVITIKLSAGVKSSVAETGKESLRLQVGANAGQEIDLSISSMKAKDLGIVQISTSMTEVTDGTTKGAALNVSTQSSASMAIEAYDKALQKVSTERAHLGAIQNRLEHTISNLDTSAENLQASESRIRDVDMADEMTKYSKNNILQQAGTSMLAQANQSNQTVLSLLG